MSERRATTNGGLTTMDHCCTSHFLKHVGASVLERSRELEVCWNIEKKKKVPAKRVADLFFFVCIL